MLVHAEWLLLRADRYRHGQQCASVDVSHARTKQTQQAEAEAASSALGATKRDAGREIQAQQAADKRT